MAASAPVLDVVVPVYNEEAELEPNIRRLRTFLDEQFPFDARITIADNASNDRTWLIARRLERELAGVRTLRLAQKGRGRALRAAWLASDALVVSYMDLDLSTSLDALLPLVAPLLSGHSDVAIGSRLAPGARVVRGPKREFISRSYNFLLRTMLRVGFRDAQCGFKAMRGDVARRLLPFVRDDAWFFDTELLVLAERSGFRVLELPVDWVDDPDSRVAILSTAVADLHGIWRLVRTPRSLHISGLPSRRVAGNSLGQQLRSFAVIGVLSTLAYAGLYTALRWLTPAALANAIALAVTAVGNTAANRRLTFGVRGSASLAHDHLAGLGAFGLALLITTAAVGLLGALAPSAGRAIELLVLIAANALATAVRFVLLRTWLASGQTVSSPASLVERIPS
jgi:putative flippase GtrA